MKIVNINSNSTLQENTSVLESAIEFNDVVVYNEMADQTAVRVNLIEQVNLQMQQLETMIQRREFVLREIFHYIVD